jgi:hypothetical protein
LHGTYVVKKLHAFVWNKRVHFCVHTSIYWALFWAIPVQFTISPYLFKIHLSLIFFLASSVQVSCITSCKHFLLPSFRIHVTPTTSFSLGHYNRIIIRWKAHIFKLITMPFTSSCYFLYRPKWAQKFLVIAMIFNLWSSFKDAKFHSHKNNR